MPLGVLRVFLRVSASPRRNSLLKNLHPVPKPRTARPNMGFNEYMRYVCGVLLLSFIMSLPAAAQSSGRVSGSVIDTAGAAIPGADVELFLTGGQKPLRSEEHTSE